MNFSVHNLGNYPEEYRTQYLNPGNVVFTLLCRPYVLRHLEALTSKNYRMKVELLIRTSNLPSVGEFGHCLDPGEPLRGVFLTPEVQSEDGLGTPQLHQRLHHVHHHVLQLRPARRPALLQLTQTLRHLTDGQRRVVGAEGHEGEGKTDTCQPLLTRASVVAEEGSDGLRRNK